MARKLKGGAGDVMPISQRRRTGTSVVMLGCPFQGEVRHADVARVATALFDRGVGEVSLGDTIGVGTAGKVQDLLEALQPVTDLDRVAVHMHDRTNGSGAGIACGSGKSRGMPISRIRLATEKSD